MLLNSGGNTLKNSLKRNKSEVEFIADIAFFIYLFTELNFKHTFIGQLGIAIFTMGTLLLLFEKKRIYNSYYFLFSVLFISYNFINVIMGYSIDSATSYSMISTLIVNFFSMFVLFNYVLLRHSITLTIKIYINSVIFFSTLLFLFSGANLFKGRLGQDISILGGSVLNSNTVATALASALIFCIYWFLENRKRIDIFKASWLFFILMLTGSRKGLIMAILGVFLLSYFMYPNKRLKNITISVIVSFVAIFLLMNVDFLYNIAGSRLEALFSFVSDENGDASLMSRNAYIELGWEYFLINPWTGYGLDTFRHFKGAYGTYSHNNYIELLVSGGIPAFLLYYVPIFLLILSGIKIIRTKKENVNISDINATKATIIVLLMLQMLEYAQVSYFERLPLTIMVIVFASIRIYKKNTKSKLT
jgi:O-antigen ligase